MKTLSKLGMAGSLLSLTAFSVQAAYLTTNVIWRNPFTGDNYYQQIQNGQLLDSAFLSQVAANWSLLGTCDFNADGNDDLFWRNASTGQTAISFLESSAVKQTVLSLTVADLSWGIAGLDDLNGDGKCDVLWRNTSSGLNYIHVMDSQKSAQGIALNKVANQNWQVAALGDFNGDGTSDIYWRNKGSGDNYIFLIKNGQISAQGLSSKIKDSNWSLVGAADLDGDKKDEIVWRNSVTGENYAHFINGVSGVSVVRINKVSDLNWKIKGLKDLNADGKADILWHNDKTGQNYIYFMNGEKISSSASLAANNDANAHVAAVVKAINSTQLPVLSGISLTPSSVTISAKQTASLAGNASYTDDSSKSVYSLTNLAWKSSNTNVATVTNGVVTGVAKGSAFITVSADGITSNAVNVTVSAADPILTSVSLADSVVSLNEGDTYTFNGITLGYDDNSTASGALKDATWTSSNTAVATVSAGVITAKTAGSATVNAVVNGVKSNDVTVDVSAVSQSNVVYFHNTSNWSKVNLYYWKPTPTGSAPTVAWPGVAMTDLGNGWFKYEFPIEVQSSSVIFNDASSQTDDLVFAKETPCYDGSWLGSCAPQGGVGVMATPGSSSFQNDVTVTLTTSGDNISVSRYVVNKNNSNLDPKTNGTDFISGQSITIGSDIAVGESVSVCIYASNSKKEANECYTYNKTNVITKPLGRCEIPEYTGNPHGSFEAMKEKFEELRIYQVMVESFVDGDSSRNYGTGYGPSHHNGDLVGIKKSLPYIKSLGANAIWMTPIFNSDGGGQLDATGYFTRYYFQVDPKFGTEQQFRELVDEAHNLGLYVILDGVFGHHKGGVPTNECGFAPQGSSNPVNYPGSLDFYKDVATYWIKEYGIDGWRLDQAYQVPVQYWTEIRKAVESVSKYRKTQGEKWGTLGYMVGEIWKGEGEIQSQGYGPEGSPGLYSNFEFPVRYSMVQTLAAQEHTEQAGAKGVAASALASKLTAMFKTAYASHAIPNLMLTNHDLVRFGDLIQRAGYGGKESDDYWNRHKAAMGFMSVFTGPITIYYGDEIGDEVANFVTEGNLGFYDDHVSRSSGNIDGVTTTLSGKEKELHDFTAKVMNLRAQHPAMWKGERIHLDSGQSIYADLKVSGTDKVVFVMNAYNQTGTVTIDASVTGGSKLVDMISGDVISSQGGQFTVSMSSIGAKLFQVQ